PASWNASMTCAAMAPPAPVMIAVRCGMASSGWNMTADYHISAPCPRRCRAASGRVRPAQQHPLQPVSQRAQLADQAHQLVAVQDGIRAVVAQVQPGPAVQIADREEAGALLPVETQAARRVGVLQRADGRGNAQVAAAVFALDFGQVDAL